jgi:hypothetical protein
MAAICSKEVVMVNYLESTPQYLTPQTSYQHYIKKIEIMVCRVLLGTDSVLSQFFKEIM